MRAASRARLAVIDVGGTMVAEGWLVSAAVQSALAEAGIPATATLLDELRGRNRKAALEAAARAAGVDPVVAGKALGGFATQVRHDILDGRYRPLPGVGHALAWLRRAGVLVVATTNFAVELRSQLLAVTGLDAYLAGAVSSGELAGTDEGSMTGMAMRRAGVTNPAEVACIGDTAGDLAAGREARVGWNFGVLTGRDDLVRLDPQAGDVIVANVSEAVAYLLGGPLSRPRTFTEGSSMEH
ncbi:MAG: HAD family hydrolase [Egibacteraceae bacterium]